MEHIPAAWTRAVAFSPDGKKLLTGDVGGMVHLWDVASGDQIYSIEAHRGQLGATAVAFSRDGHWIASGGADGVVRLWSSDGGRELLSFDTPPQPRQNLLAAGVPYAAAATGRIAALAFSPDGHYIAAGIAERPAQPGTGKIRVWDVVTNQPVCWIDESSGKLESLVFTPDGSQLRPMAP